MLVTSLSLVRLSPSMRFSDNADSIVLTALSNMSNPFISLDLEGCAIEGVSDYLADVGFEVYRNHFPATCIWK